MINPEYQFITTVTLSFDRALDFSDKNDPDYVLKICTAAQVLENLGSQDFTARQAAASALVTGAHDWVVLTNQLLYRETGGLLSEEDRSSLVDYTAIALAKEWGIATDDSTEAAQLVASKIFDSFSRDLNLNQKKSIIELVSQIDPRAVKATRWEKCQYEAIKIAAWCLKSYIFKVCAASSIVLIGCLTAQIIQSAINRYFPGVIYVSLIAIVSCTYGWALSELGIMTVGHMSPGARRVCDATRSVFLIALIPFFFVVSLPVLAIRHFPDLTVTVLDQGQVIVEGRRGNIDRDTHIQFQKTKTVWMDLMAKARKKGISQTKTA